jgi:hypothetical protein
VKVTITLVDIPPIAKDDADDIDPVNITIVFDPPLENGEPSSKAQEYALYALSEIAKASATVELLQKT